MDTNPIAADALLGDPAAPHVHECRWCNCIIGDDAHIEPSDFGTAACFFFAFVGGVVFVPALHLLGDWFLGLFLRI